MKIETVHQGGDRLDRVTGWLRLGMSLLSGLTVWGAEEAGPGLPEIWLFALLYSSSILLVGRPQGVSVAWWWMITGTIDWVLVSTGIVLDGGLRSEFYVLYFLLAFGTSVRFGLHQAILCGASTALTYWLLMIAVSPPGTPILETVALRMAYLMAVAVGSGLLAREAHRATRADVSKEAEQSAVRDIAATLSDQLLNPLAAASGLLEILLDPKTGSLTAQQRTLLGGLDGNVEHATALIRNVLLVQRMEHNQQPFHAKLTDPNDTVQRVVDGVMRLAEARGVGLVLHLTPGIPLLRLDGSLIEHALRNVLDNALEFAPCEGAIRVSTGYGADSVRIEVWNSGEPLSKRVARDPFAKFVRDRSRGIGLGLYVAKRVAHLHGGRIEACNAADGVSVMLRLPCPKPEAAQAATREAWELPEDTALAN